MWDHRQLEARLSRERTLIGANTGILTRVCIQTHTHARIHAPQLKSIVLKHGFVCFKSYMLNVMSLAEINK